MEGFLLNDWENQTNYLISTYQKIFDLFCILFMQELEEDISEVNTKFQRVSFVRWEEFRREFVS